MDRREESWYETKEKGLILELDVKEERKWNGVCDINNNENKRKGYDENNTWVGVISHGRLLMNWSDQVIHEISALPHK